MALNTKQRKQRNQLKNRYTWQLGVAAGLSLLTVFLYFGFGGSRGIESEWRSLSLNETVLGEVIGLEGESYKQSGTGVEFSKWRVAYKYVFRGIEYQSLANLDYPPPVGSSITVYFDSSNAQESRLYAANRYRLAFVFGSILISLLSSSILFLLAWLNYRRMLNLIFENS
ncbi:DUF3592 domain-containing protein [uncultured Pseudoteredinibacter sp.]|uniref:DUF3592 domain-containing protein n=1 Tax=uncultured Pseudoteredinibacter sp. TaxID=1641701 RepID=UPI00260ED33F|nr:DUF3592 domain-containing protein [uncultured Pseudoteredinibacter sp.]